MPIDFRPSWMNEELAMYRETAARFVETEMLPDDKAARKARLCREAAYRMLSDVGNPALNSFIAILAATGLRMSIGPQRLPR